MLSLKKIFYYDFIEEIKFIEFVIYYFFFVEIINFIVFYLIFCKIKYLIIFMLVIDFIDYFFFTFVLIICYFIFFILWIYLFSCFILIICVCINSWIEGEFHVDEPIFKNFYLFFFKNYKVKKNDEFVYLYKRLINLWLKFWRTHIYKPDVYIPLNEWDGIFYRCLYRFLKKHFKIFYKRYFDKNS